MLFGIDMLALQSKGPGEPESARLGRRLVAALLSGDPAHRYVLYVHEGLPTERIPSARNALRVTLPSILGGTEIVRPTVQKLLSHDPDGLDWLLLLDPFHPAYGGRPPESSLGGVKVASLVSDLSPHRVDDRRLAPLRKHDALLAYAEAVAADCRRRLPEASARVARIGMGCEGPASQAGGSRPLDDATSRAFLDLGISGPFLLCHLADGSDRSGLGAALDAYHQLPPPLRASHQLVVTGPVDDPWGALAYLHDHGCSEGLILAGEVGESTARALAAVCSAFLAPGLGGGSGLALLEALACGAPVVFGDVGDQAEVVGEAGLLADPTDLSGRLAGLLADAGLGLDLRRKALARSAGFGWGGVAERLHAALRYGTPGPTGRRLRFDPPERARGRLALFFAGSGGGDDGRAVPRGVGVPGDDSRGARG